MCGILGIIAKREYKPEDARRMFEVLFKLSESRGKEAAGLAFKGRESIDVLKMPLSVSDFLKSQPYKELAKKIFDRPKSLSVIAHSRLATHGSESDNENNQPVIKGDAVCVHNGIIANDAALWVKFPQLKREYQVDTEVLLSLLQMFISEGASLELAVQKMFAEIEGSASLALLFNDRNILLLLTNTGSLYFVENQNKDSFVFASERRILEQFADKVKNIDSFDKETVEQLSPGKILALTITGESQEPTKFVDLSGNIYPQEALVSKENFKLSSESKKIMQENWQNIYSLYDNGKIRRCVKCLLPETMTFIDFDENGVCNYCNGHKKIEVKGEAELEKIMSQYRRSDGKPDCVVGFSGGRDSAYGLHYIKRVLKMNPIAYTYDWGVLTDLGRRNQARVCGKLGVEHIILSADIRSKRAYVLANLKAWLKKPEMGMIPLLMAGDKKHSYYAEWLRKRVGVGISIMCGGNGLENEFFKIGLTGVRMTSEKPITNIPLSDKLKAASYYARQYLSNPAYINNSLFDTVLAYYYSFISPANFLMLYRYIPWNEKEILSTIINEYKWEKEPGLAATWRIDDGTAAFYNFIYLTVMGFTEFDTFRSMQIREGQITRAQALELIKEENKPWEEQIEWYAKIINFDINRAVKIVNEIPKFYYR